MWLRITADPVSGNKFEPSNKCKEVDGCVDASIMADKFAQYFSNCYAYNNVEQRKTLMDEYCRLRENYFGLSLYLILLMLILTPNSLAMTFMHLNMGKPLTLMG